MTVCAAQCGLCGDIVLAIDATQPVFCSCGNISITGNSQSSTTKYKKQEPKAFQIEIGELPKGGILPKNSPMQYQIL
jgi:hypothetical protein